MRHRSRLLASGLAVALGAVLHAQAPAPARAPAAAPAKHFLWTVSNQAGATVHLLGSIHILTPDFYPLPKPIDDAFAASKVLVEEVDLDEASNPVTAMALVGKAMYTDGTTLEQSISKETFEEVRKRAEKAGLPMMALNRVKPWMAALTLMVPMLRDAGFDPKMGVDQHFFDRAKAAGMERRGLETLVYQIDRFDGVSPKLQEAMLTAVINDLDTQVAHVKEVAKAWAAGDAKAIEEDLLGSFKDAPEIYERLLVERNRNWIPQVEACLAKNERCFVVVGAAHLVGPDSVIAMLEKKGYKVEQK